MKTLSFIEEGSVKAFKRYKEMIEKKGIKPSDETLKDNGDTTSLGHILFMCNKCINSIEKGSEMSVDKYSRWLGYIQGILIMRGMTSVENERNTTRPWLKNNVQD